MKNILIIVFVFSYSVIIEAQWLPDMRLTYSPGDGYTCLNNARGVAASGNFVHTVWADERDGNREIYYKRSTNFGASWSSDVNLSNNTATSWRPSIALNGPLVHVVWCDNRDGNFEIYYRFSSDYGANWQTETRITFTSDISWAPSLALYGQNLHITWEESMSVNEEIFYKNSNDNGATWNANTRLTFDTIGSFYPSIAVSGDNIHIVWYDFRLGNRSVFYRRSQNGGFNWEQEMKLTSDAAEAYNPAVAVSGQVVSLAWHDRRSGTEEIFYKRSTNQGTTWGADTRLTYTTGISWYPSISTSGNNVHLAWYDNTEGNYEIYYGLSTDYGANWMPFYKLTENSAGSYRPSICVSDTNVHVVWNDDRDGNFEIYYKKNPNGNVTKLLNTYSRNPNCFYLLQNYPNPFNPSTSIEYVCSENSKVEIKIFDVAGKLVSEPVNKTHSPGKYSVNWNASGLHSGVYFYTLLVNGIPTDTKKLLLLK